MFCSNCGNKLADGSKFCSGCGAKVGNVEVVNNTSTSNNNSGSIPEAARVYFEQGKEYIAQKDINNAITSFKEAIKLAPKYVEANKELIRIYKAKNKSESAMKLLDKMINENPNDAEAFLLRAEVNIQEGRFDKAMMDLNISKKIKPDYPDVYGAFAIIFTEKNENKKAIENYNEAIKLNPNDIRFYVGRGYIYNDENMFDNAVEDFSNALSIKANNAEALYGRSLALHRLNRFDDALIDVNKLLSKYSDDFDYLYLHGNINLSKGDYESAISSFDYCIVNMYQNEDFSTLELFEYHSLCCLKLKKYNKLKENYKRIYELNPDYNIKNPSIFIDGYVGYYIDALEKYKNENKTFILKGKQTLHNFKNDYAYISGVTGTSSDYRLRSSSIIKQSPIIIFFNKEDAKEYSEYPAIHWKREGREKYSSSSLINNKPPLNYFDVKANEINEEPSFWFIIHMPTGYIFNESDKYMFCLKDNRGYPPEEGASRYNTLEEAIEGYKKVITLLIQDKIGDTKLGFNYRRDAKYDIRCTDFYIAGTYL